MPRHLSFLLSEGPSSRRASGPDGQSAAGLCDVDAIRRRMYDDPPIHADDMMVAGDPQQPRPSGDFVSLAPLLATPLVALVN